MKGIVSILSLVSLMFLVACGGGITKDMDGKQGPTIEKGSAEKARVVTFSFYFDKSGATAVAAVIDKEIKNAENNKNTEKAAKLKKVYDKFTSGDFKGALKVLDKISVAGGFQGWKPGVDVLKAEKKGDFTVFTLKKEFEFEVAKPDYKFVFSLKAGDSAADLENVWVPDPLASELKDDGFGGKNSILSIVDFPTNKKDEKKK